MPRLGDFVFEIWKNICLDFGHPNSRQLLYVDDSSYSRAPKSELSDFGQRQNQDKGVFQFQTAWLFWF